MAETILVARVKYQNKFLFGNTGNGKWIVPSGRLEDEEEEESSIKRIVRDSANIAVKVNGFHSESEEKGVKKRFYICVPLEDEHHCNPRIVPCGDFKEVQWQEYNPAKHYLH